MEIRLRNFIPLLLVGMSASILHAQSEPIPNKEADAADSTYVPVYPTPDSLWHGTTRISPLTDSRAVTTLSGKDFLQGNRYSPFALMQGMVPGMLISKPGSGPNDLYDIRLRGYNSFGNSRTSPLLVINGIPETDLLNLDPFDIASIQVLRDAASAAKYGIRGSQGVIEIHTHQAETVGTSVRYQAYLSSENNVRKLESLEAGAFRQTQGTDFGADTDWVDEITQTALSQAHHLSISHSFRNTELTASVYHRDVEGIIQTSGYQQSGARLRLSQLALNDRLTLSMNVAISERNSQLANPQVYKYALIYNPTAPVFDENLSVYDGYFQQAIFDFYNPKALLDQQTRLQERISTTANVSTSYDVFEGLSAHATLGVERISAASQSYFDKNDLQIGLLRNGFASQQSLESRMDFLQLHAAYEKSLTKLSLSLQAGYSYQEFIHSTLSASGGDFLTDAFSFDNLGAALDFSNGLGQVSSSRAKRELAAYWGQGRVSWDDLLYLDATYRREGSSTLSPDNKWGTYYGVSLAANLTPYIPALWVTHFKPRISLGRVGNAPLASGLSASILGPGGPFFFAGNFVPSFGIVRAGNPDLREEETQEVNIGLDFSLFENRIHGTLGVYSRETEGIIALAPTTNVSPISFVNLGGTSMRGWDLSLGGWVMQKRDFYWQAQLILSGYGDNLLESLGGDGNSQLLVSNPGAPGVGSSPMVLLEEGTPLGQLYGFAFEGLDGNGRWQYQDLNGNGQVDFFDQGVIGSGLPSFSWSLVQTLRWKQLDLQFMFRASHGHDLINLYRFFYEYPSVVNNYNRIDTDLYLNALRDFPGGINSHYLENASFVRMEYLTLGYSLKENVLPFLSHLRAYVTFQNPITFTGYTGDDPAVRLTDPFGNFGTLASGIDRRGTYPMARGIVVGVDVGL